VLRSCSEFVGRLETIVPGDPETNNEPGTSNLEPNMNTNLRSENLEG
jgi:hypothetical protein